MIPVASMARRLRRHWALAVALALFLFAGVQALDDSMVSIDVGHQRAIGRAALNYLAGDGERALERVHFAHDRYYGAVLEAPLVLVERILGLDGRDARLSRHLLMHLLFLGGGAVCYLLVLRLFGGRALALAAMVLFLLHPRLYASSFPDSKDVPFLALFMVALYLIHRAFRRETLGAFILCGVGVGLLANLRVMGVLLFAAVLVPRALDLARARGAEERGRVLLTGAGFALAAMLAYYASLPVLWTDPVGRFGELIETLNSHPYDPIELFRGEWRYTRAGPSLIYVPVWVAITTPPATLLLAAAGAAMLAWGALRHPRAIPRDGSLRFGILLAALPVATVVAVVLLDANVSSSWRQLYFLYAPLLLLAAFGLRWLTSPLRGRWPRAGGYALAGAAVAVTLVSLARVHPNGDVSFTFLTDRATPERLASRYGPVGQSQVFAADLLAAWPSERLFTTIREGLRIGELLPPDERERFVDTRDFRSGERNLYELREPRGCPPSASYVARVYALTLHCIVDPVAYFGDLRREALTTEPLDRSHFDAHRVGNILVYVRDDCSPDDIATRFFLSVHPVDAANVPTRRQAFLNHRGEYGFETLDFDFSLFGARIDGDCVAAAPLPAYPIARIETGQYTPAWAEAARRAVADTEPAARSAFALWLDGRVLTYVGTECADLRSRFFLHVYPADVGDLPAWRVEHGFENLDFDFRTRGAFTEDGACVAVARLPTYPLASVHTGQFAAGNVHWAVRLAVTPPQSARR